MSTKKTSPGATKRPKAKVIFVSPFLLENAGPIKKQIKTQRPTALIPLPTKRQAATLAKFCNLNEAGRDRVIRDTLANGGDWSFGRQPLIADLSRAILRRLGLLGEGK